jgi:hypothetical protein
MTLLGFTTFNKAHNIFAPLDRNTDFLNDMVKDRQFSRPQRIRRIKKVAKSRMITLLCMCFGHNEVRLSLSAYESSASTIAALCPLSIDIKFG